MSQYLARSEPHVWKRVEAEPKFNREEKPTPSIRNMRNPTPFQRYKCQLPTMTPKKQVFVPRQMLVKKQEKKDTIEAK